MLCPISYGPCDRGQYSSQGLKLLSPKLETLKPFPYTQGEAIQKAAEQKEKMSISGAQPKLGAQLSLKNESFEITPKGGSFILKPNNPNFVEVPANEAATMRIAAMSGIDTPLSGMAYDKDGELLYFVKRFDRTGKKKHALEDFGQLLSLKRSTKYEASVEDLVQVVRGYTSFPAIELPKLYRLIIFNFLVGNEDAHVKNFSLLTDKKGVVKLSPAYDLVNTSVIYPDGKLASGELALTLNGKKQGLTREEIEEHLGQEVMGLSPGTINKVRDDLASSLQQAADFIHAKSFLSHQVKMNYLFILGMRRLRLGLPAPLPNGEHIGDLYLEKKDGIPMARLVARGFNMVFTPMKALEPFDGKIVIITQDSAKTKVKEYRRQP